MSFTIKKAKFVQHKGRTHTVTDQGNGWFKVVSRSSQKGYDVQVGEHGATCNCRWAKNRPAHDQRSGCSHVVQVYNALTPRAVSAWKSLKDALRQHRPVLHIGDGIWLTFRKVGT